MKLLSGEAVDCPACGEPVTMPTTEARDIGGDFPVSAVVVADKGTFHAHVRDQHPDIWQRLCDDRRSMNANPFNQRDAA